MNCKRFVFLVLMLLPAAACVSAQTYRGTVLGTVTDSSGAVVAGATVKVRNADTGLERVTQTSADGSYSAPELPFGKYTVTVSQSGFQTSVTTGVAVDVASDRRVDVMLKAGQVSESVEVSGELPASRYHQRSAGRHTHIANHREPPGQRSRLHQAHLSQSRSGWVA